MEPEKVLNVVINFTYFKIANTINPDVKSEIHFISKRQQKHSQIFCTI
jgi:hypothetical protein